MKATTKRFTAVRKPIYCAEIEANGKDFPTAFSAVKAFKQRFPEYDTCEYDSEYIGGVWHIRLYRECAVDFI